jgi:4-amino-4-deoxy-L-arabinose transferase-like glycosyltransferase
VLNVALGTLTVPLYYLLVRRAFGAPVALLAAVVLAVLPLHAELSASSLTETAVTLEIVAALLLSVTAFDRGRGAVSLWLALALALVSMTFAAMTRYEVWPLLPLIPLYVYWRRRRLLPAVLAAVVLAAFPCAWLIGNFRALGNPLPGLGHQARGTLIAGAVPLSLPGGIVLLLRLTVVELGALALCAIAAAAVPRARRASAGAGAPRTLHLAAAILLWLPMIYVAMIRGASFYPRFLLPGLVMILPWAVLPFVGRARGRTTVALVAVTCLVWAYHYVRPRYVTYRQPSEIRELAGWLAASPYRDDFLLVTDLGWEVSYLGLYLPEVSTRWSIVSAWMDDGDLPLVLRDRRPGLLITRREDGEQQARVASALGLPLATLPKVHAVGTVEVYDIRAVVAARNGGGG